MRTHQSLNTLSPDATIGQITSAGNHVADLLASIGLSPSGHEEETLRSVCQQLKWSEVEVMKWLRKNDRANAMTIEADPYEEPDFGDDICQWCSHIEVYFMDESSELLEVVMGEYSRVYQVHGTQYLWLKHLQEPLETLAEKLRYNFHFRRNMLFPLFSAMQAENELLQGTVDKAGNGIGLIREDHVRILELIDFIEKKRLRKIDAACSTLRIFSRDLQSLFMMVKKQIGMERKHLISLAVSILES